MKGTKCKQIYLVILLLCTIVCSNGYTVSSSFRESVSNSYVQQQVLPKRAVKECSPDFEFRNQSAKGGSINLELSNQPAKGDSPNLELSNQPVKEPAWKTKLSILSERESVSKRDNVFTVVTRGVSEAFSVSGFIKKEKESRVSFLPYGISCGTWNFFFLYGVLFCLSVLEIFQIPSRHIQILRYIHNQDGKKRLSCFECV